MDEIKIGLVGLGTVGSSVLKMVTENSDKVQNITGRNLSIKTVVVKNVAKHQNEVPAGVTVTDDIDKIINDPEIKIVVEVMGGVHPAKEVITALLNAKKHVVTANKDLIASAGEDLATIAKQNHCDLMYEASVAGGIPILRTIVTSFAADYITEVKGIVNGTTNFILTQMQRNHWSYDQALMKAQELGFAESDPTNDVEGIDAAYKMVILSQFSYGTHIKLSNMSVEGISTIQQEDVQQADAFGYTIKLLGISRRIDDGVFTEVGPVLVPQDHPLATINNENNAVMVTGEAVGETLFYGPGAGGLPTANSVLSDIVSVTKNIVLGTTGNGFNNYQSKVGKVDPNNVIYPYYLSLKMLDAPGQMLQFTQIMTQIGASFSQIVQTKNDDQTARVVIITHEMSKKQLNDLKSHLSKINTMSLLAAYKVL
ncbi:homoserine dehydrogenase [Lactobacillus sp. LC28-10]|uniref:Homoserine dehydrogenase n=1 Tax=Secundilactobacillus angelensis TaxID=2722706 RepID=A0ABX1KZR3_9LACO|nr:homoserine dehydrogenase [Secundilactobacillus angelensis]MCH5462880.1 homoserine dehydrogenase [Secundilactobacillus angelensis]NLR18742.1 homoserine dehydrogenase [Secundilactobacillus angelensis]